MASPISSTVAEKRWVRTEMVAGASMRAVYAASGEVGDPDEMGAERAGGECVVESPVGGDKRAVPNHRDREVDAVVDAASKSAGNLERKWQHRLGRVDLHTHRAEILHGPHRFRDRRLATAHALEKRAGHLDEDEIGNE